MLSPLTIVRLEKAAVDNGFDQQRARQGEWLSFGSTHAPLEVWLTVDREGRTVAALSRNDVACALADCSLETKGPLPLGAHAARCVSHVADLHRLLRRAYQFARTLPNELLHVFEQKTAMLPRATEAERLVVQRVGQEVFRDGLLEYWEGRCAITGLAVPELLRASHIKPWADCETDAERLDVFNGLLLAPHLDAAFDKGFITVGTDRQILVSDFLTAEARALLGLDLPLFVERLTDAHRHYLEWHRRTEFHSAANVHDAVRT
jgi:hypothetical protein